MVSVFQATLQNVILKNTILGSDGNLLSPIAYSSS